MQLDRRHLVVVTSIARTGSLSAAAAALGMSQPAVSAQLSRLEGSLGGQLFTRDRHGARTTPLGEVVVQRSEAILASFDQLVLDARRLGDHGDALHVATNRSTYSGTWVTALTAAMPERHIVPRTVLSSGTIQQALEAHQVDVAVFGVHPGVDDDCPIGIQQEIVVEREPMLIAMSESHRLATHDEVPFSELLDEEWLLPPGRPSGTYSALLAEFATYGKQPHAPLGRQQLSDYAAYVAAGTTVAVALPTQPPLPGVILRPIQGMPLCGRRVLRYWPERVQDSEAELCLLAARTAYVDEIGRSGALASWWTTSPTHRPVIGGERRPMALTAYSLSTR